ncbi:hypothetical protein [Nocardia sp. NPDC057030]|uniref:hypothetical protein n=1 Tax=unclassified Nocardia TaxID=2637762 RepID=UPI00363572CA
MTATHSVPSADGSDADQVVALVAELRESWSQYQRLTQQLRPGGPGGPAMQAAESRLLQLSKEADRQRPYLLGADQRWEDYATVDQHVETVLRQYDRTVARMRQARSEGRDGFADALERSLPGFRTEITRAAGDRADAATAAFEAAQQVYEQAGRDGVVTRGRVDAVALDAVDADHLVRRDALREFQSAEQALFRAGWTVEGRHGRDGLLRLRPCHDRTTDARFAAVATALAQSAQSTEQQPTPGVLRLRPAGAPDRHLNAVPQHEQGWEVER